MYVCMLQERSVLTSPNADTVKLGLGWKCCEGVWCVTRANAKKKLLLFCFLFFKVSKTTAWWWWRSRSLTWRAISFQVLFRYRWTRMYDSLKGTAWLYENGGFFMEACLRYTFSSLLREYKPLFRHIHAFWTVVVVALRVSVPEIF